MSRLFRALLAGLALSLLASLAHAHAVLQSASPEDGSLVETAPDAVRLRFNEAVQPLAIQLIAPDGAETDLTAAVTGAAELVVPMPGLGRGTHALSWRAASEDGHPIAGTVLFSVGEVTGTAAAMPQTGPALRGAIWLARFLMTAGLVLGVGGALFGAVAGLTPRARRPVGVAALIGLVAAPAYLGLHGLDALGLGPAALATPAPWLAAWGTSFGPSVALAVLAALLALAGLRLPLLAWPALALLGLAYAISGHAGAAAPRLLTRPMVALHLAAACCWIGALLPLALSLRADRRGLRRFSAAIPVVLVLLLASGLVLAVVQLGRDPAQWLAPYGLILAAKLALLAGLLALAAWNRWRLTGPVLAGEAMAAAAMRRVILAELALALAILGLTAAWRFTPPPRALAQAQAAAPAAYAHLHGGELMADLSVTPGSAGPVAVAIHLIDAEMAPVSPVSVSLSLSMPERGIERLVRPAEAGAGVGEWLVPDLVLPIAGRWTVEMEIRMTRFRMEKLAGEIDID